jgi:hypothetical protein
MKNNLSSKLFVEAVQCIEQVQRPLGVAIKEKMYSVLNKNPDLNCLILIIHIGKMRNE